MKNALDVPRRRAAFVLTAFAVVSILACLAYSNGVHGPPILDDQAQLGPMLRYAVDEQNPLALLISPSGPFGRPVSMLTFFVNAALTGDSLVHVKATNIALHLLAGCLIFVFVRAVLGRLEGSTERAGWGAGIVAAVWLVHPLHVSTVLYTVQRMTELAAIFSLMSLLLWLKARAPDTRNRLILFSCSLGIFWPLAVLSKEIALLIPIQIIALEMLVLRSHPWRRFMNANAMTRATLLLLCTALAALLVPATFDYIAHGYARRTFTLLERLLTEQRVLVMYLTMILLPIQSRMGFMHDDLAVSSSLLDPLSTLAALIINAGLLAVAVRLRNRRPLFAFGIAFFFIGHLLESTIFPLELMFEHRNYLPSLGILLAVYDTGRYLLAGRLSRTAASGAVIAGFLVLTFVRVHTWGDQNLLLNHAFRTHPDSPRLAIIFARELAKQGRDQRAIELLGKHDSMGHYLEQLKIECQRRGRLQDDAFLRVGAWKGEPVDTAGSGALIHLANLGLDEQCAFSKQTFLEVLDTALQERVAGAYNRDKLMIYKAHYQWALNLDEAAIETLYELNALDPKNVVALFLAAEWLIQMGHPERAEAAYRRAVASAEKSLRNYQKFEESTHALLFERSEPAINRDY